MSAYDYRNSLQARCIEAARRYLVKRGYEVLQSDWSPADGVGKIDIVAMEHPEDGDGVPTMVFVDVTLSEPAEEGFSEEKVKRHEWEVLAAKWLSENVADECVIRFDRIGVLVLGSERALLRHHINALGDA